jgi:hypothetical protein
MELFNGAGSVPSAAVFRYEGEPSFLLQNVNADTAILRNTKSTIHASCGEGALSAGKLLSSHGWLDSVFSLYFFAQRSK